MLCKRCRIVMTTGTRYEQKEGKGQTLYRRYSECGRCHDRVYTNISNFQETIANAIKNRKI